MKILAFDTSSDFCSVALWLDGKVLSRDVLAGQRHSELLLSLVEELLEEARLALAQLDGIAFGAGPGSFTGLRIACGVAQGLAFGAGLPVLGVSTLEVLAQATAAERVIACLDARIGEIYHGAYEKRGEAWRIVCPPSLCLPQDAPPVPGTGWVGCGSGFDVHPEALRQRYGGRLAGIEAGKHPEAKALAELAAPRFAAGEGRDPAEAVPLYLREKVALKESER